MTTETTFRGLVLANVALCVPIGLYHRIRSGLTRERLARREEGLVVLVGLRLCGALAWLLVIVYLIDPAWLAWSRVEVPDALRWLGGVIGVVIVPPFLLWTFRSLGKNLTDTVVTRRDHVLVTHGPYRWIRHPFYDVVFLWGLSLYLLTANGLIAVLGMAAGAMLAVRTRVEEAKLAERFGPAYHAYAMRTGRFIPLIRRRH